MSSPRRTAGLGLLATAGAAVVALTALVLALPSLAGRGRERPIILFAAAGQRAAVEPIIEEFRRETGQSVDVVWGGTGTLYGLIVAGAPCDVFVAAEAAVVERGVAEGRLNGARPLALQRAVVAVASDNPKQIKSVADLMRDDVRFALADPEQAAIGRVAQRAFENLGVWPSLHERVVVAKPTVVDAAADLRLGAVDATVLWAHLIPTLDGVEAVELADIELSAEPVVVARTTGGNGDALYAFLTSDRADLHFVAAGMTVPTPPR